jgi:hypothetical protein
VTDLPAGIPLRLYTKEVLDLVGVSAPNWNRMRDQGIAPQPKYRGRGGDVYLGVDIARFLGLVDDGENNAENDPFIRGLEKLGKAGGKTSALLRNS